MPKPYPKEFRDDVVRVAQNREEGVTLEQVAKDFGFHPMTLSNWLSQDAMSASRDAVLVASGSTCGVGHRVTLGETCERHSLRRRTRYDPP
ncbi:MAG: transposase [Acidimicrobiia bacterium]|nr:transposase [Acidimicrobiia bacterium]